MLIHRCAWHRKTFGYVAYLRVTRDGRWRVARSDGICRACRDVMLATARGEAPKSVSIKRELTKAALAVTGVAAFALLLLFAGCSDVAEPYRTSSGAWQVSARVFSEDLCGAARPFPDALSIGKLVLFVEPATLDKIDAECRAGRYQTAPPLKPLGAR